MLPDFGKLQIIDPRMRETLVKREPGRAMALGAEVLSASLNDMAIAQYAAGCANDAILNLDQSLRLCAVNGHAYHNLVSVLLLTGQLRGERLLRVQRHLDEVWHKAPWAHPYQRLFCAPQYLNVNIVSGKCNLRCRMCNGTNSAGHPNRLSWMPAPLFRAMAANAPTARAFTLSSGCSDPLLHPEFPEILAIAREHGQSLDFFTNGQLLDEEIARQIVSAGSVNMINVSLDAATPETYRRIRRADFGRVLANIERLRALQKEAGAKLPWLSLSMVAMADNIEELPQLVDLARRLNAKRVFVEGLNGWVNEDGGNRDAPGNPDCGRFLVEALRRAEGSDVRVQIHERLKATMPREEARSSGASSSCGASCESGPGRRHCPWVGGSVVNIKGVIQPCCLLNDVADMGNVADGPLLSNEKYMRVKELLLTGRVFPECAEKRCEYVAYRKADGAPLGFLSAEELASIRPAEARATADAAA